MSAKTGSRNLLIALSGIYWFWGVLHAIAVGVTEQHHTIHEHYHPLFIVPGDDNRRWSNIATERGLEVTGEILAFYAAGFLTLVAIYFTTMWIMHGFRKTS